MEERERWDESYWRQIALQPARNMDALRFVPPRLRPPTDNAQTSGAEVMRECPPLREIDERECPPLREIDEFGDGIGSFGNVLNVASGLATLGATVWSSGEDPLYLNTGGAVLSGLTVIPDLRGAIRHDPSRSQLRRPLLGVSVALNGASAVAGAGGWAWWSRHGAAMIAAWDEVFNAPLAP